MFEQDSYLNKKLIEYALRYLCLREYSEKELKHKISQKKQFSNEEFEIAFKYLRDKNYLNDERYIRQKASLLKNKGFSNNYIIQFFNKENLNLRLDEILNLDLESDDDSIKRLIKKKYSSTTFDEISITKTNSIIRYVCSKGYHYSDVKRCINSLKTTYY